MVKPENTNTYVFFPPDSDSINPISESSQDKIQLALELPLEEEDLDLDDLDKNIPWLNPKYGNTGCRVFKRGVQNSKFLPKN